MKKQLITLAVVVCALGVGVFGMLSRAAHGDDSVITDDQIQVIKSRCTDIQTTLNQLRQNDALLRVNRGAAYQAISDKLMVPLNQRIASKQLNGGDLVKITADYNTTYQQFYNAFKDYDTALSTAMGTDCTKQPTTFYSQREDARNKRLILHAASQKLVQLATSYKTTFDQIKGQLVQGGQQ